MSVLCVAGQTFTLSVRLEDQANAGKWKANPAIAAGDFKVSVNGGSYSNLDNLPTVTPASGVRVQIVLSAAETTAAAAGGLISVDAIDVAGDEWYDVSIDVRVAAVDVDDVKAATANKIADHTLRRSWTTAAASGDGDTLSFRSLLGAAAKLVNRVFISGTTMSICKSDDSTVLGTQTVTSDPSVNPVTEVDTN